MERIGNQMQPMPTAQSLIPFLDPQGLITAFGPFGFIGVCLIIFAETGLLIGFVFPGDTLLIITGLLTHPDSPNYIHVPVWVAAPAIAVAAFLGGEFGYYLGKKTGPRMFERRESGLFSRKQVEQTYRFFDRYGPLAVILARFVPVVRTLAPIAAGVGRMNYRRYSLYNAIGAVSWGFGVTFLGYLLGYNPVIANWVSEYIDVILLAAVVLSLGPTLYHVWKNHREAKRAATQGGGASRDAAA